MGSNPARVMRPYHTAVCAQACQRAPVPAHRRVCRRRGNAQGERVVKSKPGEGVREAEAEGRRQRGTEGAGRGGASAGNRDGLLGGLEMRFVGP